MNTEALTSKTEVENLLDRMKFYQSKFQYDIECFKAELSFFKLKKCIEKMEREKKDFMYLSRQEGCFNLE